MKKLITITLMLVMAALVLGQSNNKNQQKEKKTPQQLAAERQKAEIALIRQIQTSQANPQQMANLCEEFIKKYPNSKNMAWTQFMATMAYQRVNNFEKMQQHALVAMKMLPTNPVIPAIMSSAYAEHNMVDEAEKMSTNALALINKLVKPESLPQAQWDTQLNELKCTVYSALGYVYLQKAAKIDKKNKKARMAMLKKSIDAFTEATNDNKLDDISYYRMGIAYALMNKVDESLDSYAKAVAIGRSVKSRASSDMHKILDTLKKTHALKGRTFDGLVAKAKQELGLQKQ